MQKKTTSINFRVTRELRAAIEMKAQASQRSISEYLNLALSELLLSDDSKKIEKPKKARPKSTAAAVTTPEADEVTTLFDYLNDKAGSGFIPRGKDGKLTANGKLCAARLKEYGLNKLMLMIDHKCDEWEADDKMHKYLRPITLFNASKCGDYVGSIGKTARKKRSSLDEFLGRTGNDLEGDYKVL